MSGYIYILTNPDFGKTFINVGYASDVEQERRSFARPALQEYEIYATYETSDNFEPKQIKRMLSKIIPCQGILKNGSIFMSPDDAYKILEAMATITDTRDKLIKFKEK